jgi:hypothetical protein
MHGPPWTDGGTDTGTPGRGSVLAGARPAPEHGSSLTVVEKREEGTGTPFWDSPELGR